MNNPQKLPIGIQNFEKIRLENYLYVDKTRYIWNLVNSGCVYFLSRPRRFGKSLLLSTLRAYFEGKKELFDGLYISTQEKEWQTYPVFHFDFNGENFFDENGFNNILNRHLKRWEEIYGKEDAETTLAERFAYLLEKAHQKTGKRVVVLIDEYDKGMLESKIENIDNVRNTFKGVFSNLKSGDEHLKFVFITGITKFSKVSIFSDINQPDDISMTHKYAEICGITEEELKQNFLPHVERMAKSNSYSIEECFEQLKQMYDGYHFSENSQGMYNPFSLLNALNKEEFKSFWFETGTPKFLVERLEKTKYHIQDFSEGVYRNSRSLTDYRADNSDVIPLFYQTGYLTIKDYDKKFDEYLLKYPNAEVKYAFLESLVPVVFPQNKYSFLDIKNFTRDLQSGNIESVMLRLKSLFASLPYGTKQSDEITEQNFQNVIYLVFMLIGQFVEVERHYSLGRADCIVQNDDYVYIFEFKRDKSAQEALNQIEEAGYATPFLSDKRKLIKIGANFSTEERALNEWLIV